MSISITDLSSGSSSTGTTATLTGATVPASAMCFVAVCEYDSSGGTGPGASLSDGTNNYTLLDYVETSNSTIQLYGFFYTAPLSNATLTYTKFKSGASVSLSAFYAIGVNGKIDSSVNVGSVFTGNPATISLTSGSPSASGDLIIAIAGGQTNGSGYSFTNPGSWSNPPDAVNVSNASNTSSWLAGGYLINNSSGQVTFAPTMTSGNGSRQVGVILVGLASAPSSFFNMPMLGM